MNVQKLIDRLSGVRKNVEGTQEYAGVIGDFERDRILADMCDALALLLKMNNKDDVGYD